MFNCMRFLYKICYAEIANVAELDMFSTEVNGSTGCVGVMSALVYKMSYFWS